MIEKKRLDLLVVEQGIAETREKAKALIMAGTIYVDNQKADKPGAAYPATTLVELRGKTMPYVSRGGYKLEKAMKSFSLSLLGKTCMDIGASTGGFTDCMLQHGAKKVYAIDVGYGQLAWKLRMDERVINLERTNVRYITKEQVPDPVDFFSVDVSFISLCLVLPAARALMKDHAQAVCLIKPQFEAGREKVGKKGVVKDPKVHEEVIKKIILFAQENGFCVLGLDFSPVKGPRGNIEYLLHLQKEEVVESKDDYSVKAVVEISHKELDGGDTDANSDSSQSE